MVGVCSTSSLQITWKEQLEPQKENIQDGYQENGQGNWDMRINSLKHTFIISGMDGSSSEI